MNPVQLSLETLKLMDGGAVRFAFDAALRELATDMAIRPQNKKKRSVTLSVECEPFGDDSGVTRQAVVKVMVKKSIPQQRSSPFQMDVQQRADGDSMLIFKPDSPEDVRQQTFNDLSGGPNGPGEVQS